MPRRTKAPLRVLIVEDETIIALDIQDVLEGAGYTVVGHATSMKQALALADKATPQLAIVDMTLGGREDGLETARALGEKHGIPVLFLTGSEAFLVRAMSMNPEPLGYVLKPYMPDDILGPLKALAQA